MNRMAALVTAIAVAILALGIGLYLGGNWSPTKASLDLSCGTTTYTVSTGNAKGECQSSGINAVCADNSGNSTEVSCASGCMNAKGSAKCEKKKD